VKKKSTWVSSHCFFYHFWAFCEYTETLDAFFVDFLKSILSNKRRTKTKNKQRKTKSGKNSILELFYMYPIFGGFATQKSSYQDPFGHHPFDMAHITHGREAELSVRQVLDVPESCVVGRRFAITAK